MLPSLITSQPWILASSSKPRAELLERFGMPFSKVSPDVDESPQPGESITDQTLRLSLAKAQAVAEQHPNALVIAGDQLAELDGQALGKPGDFDAASKQLRHLSGQTAVFHAGICVYHAASSFSRCAVVDTQVTYQHLDEASITYYLKQEQPFTCAGSLKSEGLGIALTSGMQSSDPTALIGLPLITLTQFIQDFLKTTGQ